MIRAIRAASALGAQGRTTCKRLVGATTSDAGIEQSVALVRITANELLRQMRELADTLAATVMTQ